MAAANASRNQKVQANTVHMKDGTPVVILSWTGGGPDFPIVGCYRPPQLPWMARRRPLIYAQWDSQGRILTRTSGSSAKRKALVGLENVPRVHPEEAPLYTKTQGGHPVTIVSLTAGSRKHPLVGVITYPETGALDIEEWDADGWPAYANPWDRDAYRLDASFVLEVQKGRHQQVAEKHDGAKKEPLREAAL